MNDLVLCQHRDSFSFVLSGCWPAWPFLVISRDSNNLAILFFLRKKEEEEKIYIFCYFCRAKNHWSWTEVSIQPHLRNKGGLYPDCDGQRDILRIILSLLYVKQVTY